MRIIAGSYKGKKLFTPSSQDIRPTADRAREALFNILRSNYIDNWEDFKLLDVFAGTGAFGLEAISRGAALVCFVDKDTSLAIKNATLFPKEKEKIKFIKSDATSLPVSSKTYNMVFMDAPYSKGFSEKCLLELKNKKWIEKGSICIVELNKKEEFSLPDGFEEIDNRIYGISRFIFIEAS